jgi:hypothetical protein
LFDDSDCSFAIHLPQGDSANKDDLVLWTATDHPKLPFAMFYSDCMHEVRKVSKGHRATLTFKIYAEPWRSPFDFDKVLTDVIPLFSN